MCVPDLHTTARLQVAFVLSTALPLLAAAALLCFIFMLSCLQLLPAMKRCRFTFCCLATPGILSNCSLAAAAAAAAYTPSILLALL